MLIKKYAGENAFNEFLSEEDEYGYTPLHIAAACIADLSAIEMLIYSNSDINKESSKGFTPFHRAVEKNTFEVVEFLINNGAEINKTDNNGYTPLHFAVHQGKYNMAVLLKVSGADLNSADANGLTPLHHAVGDKKSPVFIDLLATPQNINAQTKNGYTPLHFVFMYKNTNEEKLLVQKLLYHKARVDIADYKGNIPLHLAIFKGMNREVLELLIAKETIDHYNENRQTPLHIAAMEGRYDAVVLLKESGADLNPLDKNRFAPLCYAIEKGHGIEFFDLLATKDAAPMMIISLVLGFKLYKKTELKLLLKKIMIASIELMEDELKECYNGFFIKLNYRIMIFIYKTILFIQKK